MSARFIVGDVFGVLAKMPDDSVDLVLSSPPFLALRSYLPDGHPNKGKEIGSEATPADFIDTLLDVVEACDRVLAPHGSLAIELGDTFAGSGGAGGDYNPGGLREGQDKFEGTAYVARQDTKYPKVQRDDMPGGGITNLHGKKQGGGNGWPLDKSLCGIPSLFANSLAYGRNLLRPERSTPPWRIRNMVVWARPNPPVGALGDKFRPSTSYLTVATKGRTRWFDLDAVRTPVSRRADTSDTRSEPNEQRNGTNFNTLGPYDPSQTNGAPPLDYWVIPTQRFSGSHYATFPEELCRIPIESMCPREVCQVCGEPRRRMMASNRPEDAVARAAARHPERLGMGSTGVRHIETRVTVPTESWTACGHDDYRRGVVLDPFAGSGTTLQVATGHGRDAIGIDIDERNAEMAQGRVGMFLEVINADVDTPA